MDLGCGPPQAQASALPPDPGDKKLRRCDSVFDTSGMSNEERAKLNSCLDHILDIVGDTVYEFTIKEAIVRCKFDVEKALIIFLTSPRRVTSKLVQDNRRVSWEIRQSSLQAELVEGPVELKSFVSRLDASLTENMGQ